MYNGKLLLKCYSNLIFQFHDLFNFKSDIFIFIISTLNTLLQSSYFGSLIFKYLKTPKKFLIKSGEKWIYCYSENKYRSCYSILVGITLVSTYCYSDPDFLHTDSLCYTCIHVYHIPGTGH